ncbi:MAG: glycogen debranching enzyme family protein [Salinivirgaceae bacterium]|nr:glycogen debranching enzyme family protein [Salinivirgaceae bacterium]
MIVQHNSQFIKEIAMDYLTFNKQELINLENSLTKEVLRTNRAGTYSLTTLIGCNNRKYHGMLVCPLPQVDGGRHVLLSSLDETIIQHEHEFNLALHKYEGDNYEPKGHKYVTEFYTNPIPTLVYGVGGVVLKKEKILVKSEPRILIRYTLVDAHSDTKIRFKPFLAFRNIHALSKANLDANTKVKMVDNGISSCMYNGYPNLYIQTSKKCEFVSAPDWYYNIEYILEQKRGYDFKEDLFVPGYFEASIKKGESIIVSAGLSEIKTNTLKKKFEDEVSDRTPRNSFENCLINGAAQLFLNEGKETRILAGFPWYPARSRDALIALPNLLYKNESPMIYKSVLSTLINQIINTLTSNSTNLDDYADCRSDVPLWLVWCIQQIDKQYPEYDVWKEYGKDVKKVMNSYLDHKISFRIDDNGMVFNTSDAVANTWMNSTIYGHPVTPRNGYAVETNALWYNAIMYCLDKSKAAGDKAFGKKWADLAEKLKNSFNATFWNDERGYLADYVVYDYVNAQVRPNQLLACAVDYCMLDKHQIKSVLRVVEEQLMTPYGIRSLTPDDPRYVAHYRGTEEQRENAAFNGSVWPWLYAAYIDALQKIQPRMVESAVNKFLETFEPEMRTAGISCISEMYHGDPPYHGKGAISFALSFAALLYMKKLSDTFAGNVAVAAEPKAAKKTAKATAKEPKKAEAKKVVAKKEVKKAEPKKVAAKKETKKTEPKVAAKAAAKPAKAKAETKKAAPKASAKKTAKTAAASKKK